MFYYCVGLFVFVQYGFADNFEKYMNLKCKNNGNEPVDWWFIYKPPLSDSPHFNEGGNFTFLTELDKRWQQSEYNINYDSMLQHTLQPLFQTGQRDKIAWLVNSGRTELGTLDGSLSYVVMMADDISGIWLGHSIPGFPNFHGITLKFPEEELKNGHYLVCLSLDLSTLNILGSVVKETNPVVHLHVPPRLDNKLQFWKHFNRRNMRNLMSFDSDSMDIITKGLTLPVHIMIRRPNDRRCLYKRFAEKKQVILDIYGHDFYWFTYNFCSVSHGIRRIDTISLKFSNEVVYIRNESDKMSFGVTTAAHWQRQGLEPNQYWACLSTLERDDSSPKGGLILCANSYDVWWNFDNFKVKEPEC